MTTKGCNHKPEELDVTQAPRSWIGAQPLIVFFRT